MKILFLGKSNFWDYEQALFGVDLPPNVGLTGKGMAGTMDLHAGGTYFVAEGIPLTEFTDGDLVKTEPFQLATVIVRDADTGQVLGVDGVSSLPTLVLRGSASFWIGPPRWQSANSANLVRAPAGSVLLDCGTTTGTGLATLAIDRDEIDTIITDDALPATTIRALRKLGPQVICAE